jgi:hypothetical protein
LNCESQKLLQKIWSYEFVKMHNLKRPIRIRNTPPPSTYCTVHWGNHRQLTSRDEQKVEFLIRTSCTAKPSTNKTGDSLFEQRVWVIKTQNVWTEQIEQTENNSISEPFFPIHWGEKYFPTLPQRFSLAARFVTSRFVNNVSKNAIWEQKKKYASRKFILLQNPLYERSVTGPLSLSPLPRRTKFSPLVTDFVSFVSKGEF